MKHIRLTILAGTFIACSTSYAMSAGGDIITIDVVNWQTFGQFGADDNSRLEINFADEFGLPDHVTHALITGIGYDLHIETIGPSWLSDVAIAVTTATQAPVGNGVRIATTTSPGTGSFTSGGILKYEDIPTSNGFLTPIQITDATLTVEVFDTFDDGGTDVQDAVINGTIFLQLDIPSPATLALLGIAALATPRRRRN